MARRELPAITNAEDAHCQNKKEEQDIDENADDGCCTHFSKQGKSTMPSVSYNTSDIQQEFYNNITSQNQQSCIAQVDNNISANSIIVKDSRIKGDFTGILSGAKTDASCIIVSGMDTVIDNKFQAVNKQKASATAGLWSIFNWSVEVNDFNLKQTAVNNIHNVNGALCDASRMASVSGNYIYANNVTVDGNYVGVSTSSDVRATCSLTNMMKTSVYNSAVALNDQTAEVKSVWEMIVGAIVFVVFLVVGMVVLMTFLKSRGKKEVSSPAPASGENPLTGQLSLLSSAGSKDVVKRALSAV